MKAIQLISLALLLTVTAACQEYKEGKMTQLGFNMTEMASQFIPIGKRLTRTGPFHLMWRPGSNGKFFNLQIGVGVDDFGDFDNNLNWLNLAMGIAKMKWFNEKWYYTSSKNIMVSSGFLNLPNEEVGFFGFEEFVGFNFSWGAGYKITDLIALTTETQFIISSSEFRFIPPLGLFLVMQIK